MKKALITGITGQDGSYPAELLLEKGYEVHGIIRSLGRFPAIDLEDGPQRAIADYRAAVADGSAACEGSRGKRLFGIILAMKDNWSMNDIRQIWSVSCPLRFLVVGVWNFAFGYGVFAGLYWAVHEILLDWLILVVATILGITMSFVTHRFITYRSNGPWIKEYFRFYVVYGMQSALNILLFWILVTMLKRNAYVVQFILTVSLTLASYWVHKRFSFRKVETDEND